MHVEKLYFITPLISSNPSNIWAADIKKTNSSYPAALPRCSPRDKEQTDRASHLHRPVWPRDPGPVWWELLFPLTTESPVAGDGVPAGWITTERRPGLQPRLECPPISSLAAFSRGRAAESERDPGCREYSDDKSNTSVFGFGCMQLVIRTAAFVASCLCCINIHLFHASDTCNWSWTEHHMNILSRGQTQRITLIICSSSGWEWRPNN